MMPEIYSQDYFSGAKKGFGYVDYEADKKPMAATFDFYLDKIEKFFPGKGKLLDIGSATGYFLNKAKNRSWDVTGVEISEYAAAKAREKGLNVITGTLENLNAPDEHFDVLTFWDVIEHLPDPKSQLLLAWKILKNGGLIAINTPDSGSFVAKLLGKRWHLLVPPEHLMIFNRANLDLLLRSCGFEVLWTGKIGKKFTLQYIFQIFANWQRSPLIRQFAGFLKNNAFGSMSLPLNLRDNFFIIARKND